MEYENAAENTRANGSKKNLQLKKQHLNLYQHFMKCPFFRKGLLPKRVLSAS